MSKKPVAIFLFLFITVTSRAQFNNDLSALEVSKAWWHAIAGDTSFIKKHSTGELTVTFNNGRSFNGAEIIAHIATNKSSSLIKSEWSDEIVQNPTPQTAIISNRVVETVGAVQHIYKFITVLVRKDSIWKVAAAQSTRVLELAPPVPVEEAGKLEDFAGSYRTPGGMILKILVREVSLVLVEPSGSETKLEAIGPGLFEIPKIIFAGNVRFSFSRNDSGQVVSMTRIAHKITNMPRIK